jgi:hypothetical protein
LHQIVHATKGLMMSVGAARPRSKGFSAGCAGNSRMSGPICISRGTRDRRVRATAQRFRRLISVSNFAGAACKPGHKFGPFIVVR